MSRLTPTPYKGACSDIRKFLRILRDGRKSLETGHGSPHLEAGLAYTCARNIAMAASWHIANQPIFGPNSPYEINMSLPIPRETYDTLRRCRMSRTRDIEVEVPSAQFITRWIRVIEEWANDVFIATCDVDNTVDEECSHPTTPPTT